MTNTTAPRSTNVPPPEQPSRHKKVKRPSVLTSRHTVCLGVIGTAETALSGAQKGVPAAAGRLISLRADDDVVPADDPVSLHADDASDLHAAEDVELCSR